MLGVPATRMVDPSVLSNAVLLAGASVKKSPPFLEDTSGVTWATFV